VRLQIGVPVAAPPGAASAVKLALLAALALAAPAAPARAEDWPCWLGPQLDGSSRETGWLKAWPAEGPPRLFERPVGEGYSAVSVAAGHLLVYHRRGSEAIVESLDPLSGAGRWRFSHPTSYVDDYGYSGGPRCQPIVHREGETGWVYALSSEGVIHALDLATGKALWQRDVQGELSVGRNFFGVGAAPIVDRGRVLFNLGGTETGSGATVALDAATGEVAWKAATDGGAYAACRVAEIDGARHLFVFHRGGLSCLDPADGRQRWKFPWRSRTHESVNAATPLVAGDLLFFSATYGTGGVCLRIKKDAYEVVWKDELARREKILETHWSTANLVGGHLYGFSGRHEGECDLRAVELATGKVAWKWEPAGPGEPAGNYLGRGVLLHSDGHFIALGERGDLALLQLDPKGHTELRRVRRVLRYPAWTPPVLAGGVLYLRDEHQLIAMDLRPPPQGASK
jgi:hypothetical protein